MSNSRISIDRYLNSLRAALATIPPSQADEVVRELRAHIEDSISSSATAEEVDAVLRRLGSPDALAAMYRPDTPTPTDPSPSHPLRTIAFSLFGIFAFITLAVGYLFAGTLAICAFNKPLHPQLVGLWRLPDPTDIHVSLHLGLGGGLPPDGRELLGWWIIPVSLALGIVVCYVTSKLALWWVHALQTRGLVPLAHRA